MENIGQLGIVPIQTEQLNSIYSNYRSPKDKIRSLEQQKQLIHVKRGLYVASPDLSGQTLSLELIANHVYGPSYVSFETALSIHGLIPEYVRIIKSATSNRKKIYSTPLGQFEFITVPEGYFAVGLTQITIGNACVYIAASREKALCDTILATAGLRLQSRKAMAAYLFDDLRIEPEVIWTFDRSIVQHCIETGYKKDILKLLLNFIQ